MSISLERIRETGPFDYKWPATIEQFDEAWDGVLIADPNNYNFRHGVGRRLAYGAERVHSVTFLDGSPIVEGVAADDYQRSRKLLSLIKPSKGHRLARELGEVPIEYAGLEIVSHRDEIDAPYSKRCLALKIREDDLETWALHAIRRRLTQGR